MIQFKKLFQSQTKEALPSTTEQKAPPIEVKAWAQKERKKVEKSNWKKVDIIPGKTDKILKPYFRIVQAT